MTNQEQTLTNLEDAIKLIDSVRILKVTLSGPKEILWNARMHLDRQGNAIAQTLVADPLQEVA